jgi:hypothetical protein
MWLISFRAAVLLLASVLILWFGWVRRRWIQVVTYGPHMFFDPRTTYHAFSNILVQPKPSVLLTVVIPVTSSFAGIHALSKTISEVIEYLLSRKQHDPDFSFEILVVSTAQDAQIWNCVTGFTARVGANVVRLFDCPHRFGTGAATALGLKLSRGLYILTVPSDNSVPIRNIEKLESVMYVKEKAHLGVILGNRVSFRESAKKYTFTRNIVLAFASLSFMQFLNCVLTTFDVDVKSPFALFTRKTATLLCNPGMIDWLPLDDSYFPASIMLLSLMRGSTKVPIAGASVNDVSNDGGFSSFWRWLSVFASIVATHLQSLHGVFRSLLFLRSYNVWNVSRPVGSI